MEDCSFYRMEKKNNGSDLSEYVFVFATMIYSFLTNV